MRRLRLFAVSLLLFLAPEAGILIGTAAEVGMVSQDVSVPGGDGFFPSEVLFRTGTQSYCKYYSFVLVDGRIYSRRAGADKWELFLKTGLPFPQGYKEPTEGESEEKTEKRRALFRKTFPVPARIVELSADADSLYVFDDKGICYSVFLHSSAPEKAFVWRREFGFPKEAGSYLEQDDMVKDHRAWSMGCRRRDVLYHTDIYGNEHHYGTMGLETLYFLTADGSRIRFTDSGLPADFSREIQLPEDGRFIAQNLSVSADTIFIIGDKGTMYTRLIDFDTMGCDPMWFQYTYDKLEQKRNGHSYLSNYSPWALPAEGWRRQEAIPLTGKARLTKIISIAQNGEGNGARILRVAGLNEAGERGYYEKLIFDNTWRFVKADLAIQESDMLSYTAEKTEDEREYDYSGELSVAGRTVGGITCRIKGVSLASESTCRLTLTDGRQSFTCTVYAVEKWTYVKRRDPGRDGTSRAYFVTLELNENTLGSYTGAFGEELRRVFSGMNHKLFAFSAEGNTETFWLRGETSASTMLSREEAVFMMSSDETASVQRIASSTLPLLESFNSPDFLLPEGKTYSIRERTKVQNVLNNNIAYKEELISDLNDLERIRRTTRQTRFGYSVVDFIARITFLNQLEFPKIKQLTSFGGEIVESSNMSFEVLTEYRNFAYQRAAEIIDLRIECYRKILSDFDDNKYESFLSSNLKNSFTGFFDLAGLPDRASSEYGTMERYSDVPYLSAFRLETAGGSHIAIVLTGCATEIFDAAERGRRPPDHTLHLSAMFVPLSVSHEDSQNKVFKNIERKKGEFEWDGRALRVYVKGSLTSPLIFESAASGEGS